MKGNPCSFAFVEILFLVDANGEIGNEGDIAAAENVEWIPEADGDFQLLTLFEGLTVRQNGPDKKSHLKKEDEGNEPCRKVAMAN